MAAKRKIKNAFDRWFTRSGTKVEEKEEGRIERERKKRRKKKKRRSRRERRGKNNLRAAVKRRIMSDPLIK